MKTDTSKRECRRCDGRGWVTDYGKRPGSFERAKTCPACNGTGEQR